MSDIARPHPDAVPAESLRTAVRAAVLWRSGSQIVAQVVQWAATFLVIRILSPSDYGLFAMTQVVLTFLNMLNGYGLASGLVRAPHVGRREIRQLFGMLIVLNGGLAVAQVVLAPHAAHYYGEPVVADMLRVQALLYLATPFVALPYALLSRAMDFRHQAKANIAAAILSAAAALTGALAGLGVWTLVLAPLVLFATRGVLMTRAAGSLVPPSFDFRGAGALARYGGVMAAGQVFWFLQSQADVFLAGSRFTPHDLGLYTTALFLAQIFVAKVVPPLNEVAFSAYARLQHDRESLAAAFLKGLRIVMVAGLPFYLGLWATADVLVPAVLGPKWTGAGALVATLALAMPFMTVQVLLTPACDARARPGVGVANGATGAVVLGGAFLLGVAHGPQGLAWAWVAAYPVYLVLSLRRALPVIGARWRDVAAAVSRPLTGSAAMAALVRGVDAVLPPMAPLPHLALLVAVGVAAYAAWLALFARPLVRELAGAIRR